MKLFLIAVARTLTVAESKLHPRARQRFAKVVALGENSVDAEARAVRCVDQYYPAEGRPWVLVGVKELMDGTHFEPYLWTWAE